MNEIYHVLNRGVDKRKIFMDDEDYLRFIHDLFEFNDKNWVNNSLYRFSKNKDLRSPYIRKEPRKLLINLHAFCLMPNHYHLLLTPKTEGDIPKFMRKLNIGYAKYFNEKYKRTGALFEGRYKSVAVKNEAHFIHLPYYIHLNPLDIKFKEWRERKLKNYKEAMKFLENYRWSSFPDYIGKKNFPSVTQREFLLEFLGGPEEYKKNIASWLKELDLEDIKDFTLEKQYY